MTVKTSRVILPAAVTASGTVGAVVGGTVAVAKDIKKVKDGSMTKKEAAGDVARESLGTGLSTAAGVAVIGAAGIGGVVGLLGIVGVASGTKYLWDKAFASKAEKKAAVVASK
ncbi:magnetosome protein MamC [Maridesulfovibrio bastinii]|jgi:hypothetical protein|uniref:magnetosome protein MamC n=1 Tax=Maridesulfovibrio bastinii TaxID=47157 RepID=UPI0004111D86|nr:magnetosome protein MamC [Maridesulfovibrio bastinii]